MTIPSKDQMAFGDLIPIIEPAPKPREVGLTEVRSMGLSVARIAGILDTFAPYIDSIKWAVGTQRLMTRGQVREINDYVHSQNVEVSSGGLLESVLPLGHKAVRQYLEESRELGFDIIEISAATVAMSLNDICGIVRAVNELGLKPKPEIVAWAPNDKGKVSAEKMVREAEAVLEAGAWKVMVEEDGIFSIGNDGLSTDQWNRDLAYRLAGRIPVDKLYWEGSSFAILRWLLNAFGPDVNLFTGHENLGTLSAFRTGAFVQRIGSFSTTDS